MDIYDLLKKANYFGFMAQGDVHILRVELQSILSATEKMVPVLLLLHTRGAETDAVR
jgi:hypothetical protein